MGEQDLVEVYRAADAPMALAVQQMLAEAGIRAIVDHGLLHGAIGELPPGWATAPRLLVERRDRPLAREIVRQFERSRPPRTTAAAPAENENVTRCLACGARMKEQEEKCPACGWSYRNGPAAADGV